MRVATTIGLVSALGLWAASETQQPPAKKDATAVQKAVLIDDIETALEKSCSLDFQDTPLAQALRFIAVQSSIRLVLDEAGLSDVGINRDTPIAMQLESVKVRVALDLILQSLNLDYYIHENILVVTSRDVVEGRLETKVHRIADFAPEGGEIDEDIANSLTELLTSSVNREIWKDEGGEGTIKYSPIARSLVITASAPVQRKVSRLIDDLREARLAGGMPRKKANNVAAR